MMTEPSEQKRFKILFLCTGNSARSILAEFFLKRLAPTRFDPFSAGASPKGQVNAYAQEILRDQYHIDRDQYHIDPSEARSKSWDEFRGTNFDFVITVCDNARESCPVWPGQPIVAHWGSEDPDLAPGTEEEKCRVFKRVAGEIYRRLSLFTALPMESLDRLRLEEMTKAIGKR